MYNLKLNNMSKTWQEKFETKKVEQVKRLDTNFADMKAGDLMLISTPKKIVDYINSIPKNENRDLSQMRIDLAKQAKADITCPVTSGIFTRIIAERSLELMAEGKDPIAPFWKVIDPKSSLAKKLSCGPELIENLRRN
jgi:hypothetical protein